MSTSTFIQSMDKLANSTVGENGSKMYSMNELDNSHIKSSFLAAFNGILENTYRNQVDIYINNIIEALEKNTEEVDDKELIKMYEYLFILPFLIRDIRNNGKGRRREFYYVFHNLFKKFPEIMLELLEFIPEFGYWKDLNNLYEYYSSYSDTSSQRLCLKIIELYVQQIKKDIEDYQEFTQQSSQGICKLSLACKWLPKERRSLDRKTRIYSKISADLYKLFHPDAPSYLHINTLNKFTRQQISPIQDKINTTEKLECNGKFHEINFQFVPGRTMNIKKNAYLNQYKDGSSRSTDERRIECRSNLLDFLELAKQRKVTLHGKTMYIHELASQVSSYLTKEEEEIINLQYQDHYLHFKKILEEKKISLNKGIVLADFSGSMEGSPMLGALAITILVSDLADTHWRNKFISFESEPRWISLTYPVNESLFQSSGLRGVFEPSRINTELTFCEKVRICKSSPWGGSTNFLKAHDLILHVATKNNVAQEDMPEWFVCPSDMQFDCACGSSIDWDDNYELLEAKYNQAGYIIPQMIYWNMRATNTFVTQNREGVQQLSGFSTMQLKNFLETLELTQITPWDTLITSLSDDSYHMIVSKLHSLPIKPFHMISIESDLQVGQENNQVFKNTLDNLKTMCEKGVLSEEDFQHLTTTLEKSIIIEMD